MYFNENEHFSKNCSRVTSKDLHVHMYIDKYGISLKTYLIIMKYFSSPPYPRLNVDISKSVFATEKDIHV